MNTRTLGKTNFKVAEIGLGCWQLGGTDWGELDERTATEILYEAVDNGVNFLDTAETYGDGRSERLIGHFVKHTAKHVHVATKIGRGSMYPDHYSDAAVRTAAEGSLKRLGVDALDLLQLHCVPGDVLRHGAIFDWMDRLRQQGKVKAWGASVETVDEALICLEQPGCATLQLIFNIFRQKPIKAVFAKAKARNVGIIARLPLASGLLGGKFKPGHQFPATDHRNYNRNGQEFNVGETFAGLPFDVGLDLVEALEDQLPRHMTLPQMALRWILDFDAVSVVIPGASKVGQISELLPASDLKPLSHDMHDWLTQFYAQRVSPYIRGPY